MIINMIFTKIEFCFKDLAKNHQRDSMVYFSIRQMIH